MAKKLSYDVVLTKGKSARKMERANKKAAEKKGILESPLGKMRTRQERKAIAKSLKVPFSPRYNGPRFHWIDGKDEEGNDIKLLEEIK